MQVRIRAQMIGVLLAVALSAASGLACTANEDGAPSEATALGEEAPPEAASEAAPEVIDDERSVAARLRDAAVAAKIKMALVEERSLRRYTFEPRVHGGEVTLEGEVETAEQRTLAADIARQVEGVRQVVNAVEAPGVPAEAPLAAREEPPSEAPPAEPPAPAERETTPQEQQEPAEVAAAQEEEAQEEAPQEQAQPSETYHTVKSGESLWAISRKYGVSVDQIKRLSNLGSNSIRPGQRLRVK